MESVRSFVGLCRAARNTAAVRTRQPLKTAYVWGADAGQISGLEFIITDEVNVKEIKVVASGAQYLDYRLSPKFELIGPKYGKNVGRVGNAVKSSTSREAAELLAAGKMAHFDADGFEFDLLPDEVVVKKEAREGFAAAEEELRGVALDLAITPELRLEGLAREVVNRVQKMRKDAGFDVEDTIISRYDGSPEMLAAVAEHADYIKRETLSLDLVHGHGENEFEQEYKVDGYDLHLEVLRSRK
jgi:isoleucyl-tRNA synthetase